MKKLVLIRHGESVWNKENRFTGWVDVELSENGRNEAKKAAHLLKNEGFTFDLAFTSFLKRAIGTLWIILGEMDLMWIEEQKTWRLNERHYGGLQGLNKSEMAVQFGEEQVHVWRRSYDVPPPALDKSDDRFPGHDPRYALLSEIELPVGECLKDTVARVVPYWENVIAPSIRADKKVIVAAHGNSLRSLVKYLSEISDEEIVALNIPTGIPLIYELDEELKPLKSYYLGDPEEIVEAQQAVAEQGKAQ